MSSRRDDAETMLDSDAVPSSLIEIAPIFRTAKQFDISNPRVAYLCRFYAFEKSTRLDPTSSGRGVRQFRTSLLQRLEKEQETTYRERKAMSDAREMQNFYRDYFQKYIQDMKDAADKPDQRPQLAKTYQTAAILFEVLKAVDPKPEAVPDSENRDIMGSQIQAAVSALRNPKADEKKENEDILDWLQAMFGFQVIGFYLF
ncbi:Callose synthase 2 [Linum grandiflorum]